MIAHQQTPTSFAQEQFQHSPGQEKPPLPLHTAAGLLVPTNQPFIATVESIQNAASGADRWQYQQQNPPYYVRQTEKNSTIVEYGRSAEQEMFEDHAIFNLWQDLQTFSDRDADLLLYAFSTIIKETNGQGAAWIWATHFLDQRGIKPITKRDGARIRRAGYRTEDLLDLDASLYRISGLWVTIEERFPTMRKGGKPRVYRHKGRVLSIVETWLQETLSMRNDNLERLPVAWKLRAGDWLMTYLNAPRYVAFLCDQSLKYDPYREQWEKRLSRYLLFFLRINSRHGSSTLVRSVEELLQANSLPVDTANPQRVRDRLEKALNRLCTDQQIACWEYVPESTTRLPTKKWLSTWLSRNVRIVVQAHPAPPE